MKRRILFVDDEPNFLDGLRRMLSRQRLVWDMHFANGVDEAENKMREMDFDAVVSDVMMPLRDGFSLLASIRETERTRDVPVIMLTGLKERDLKRRALEMGATDLLNKPVEQEDLTVRLESVLRLKSYQDEIKAQNALLEQKVRERTQQLMDSRLEIIWRLGATAEFRDEETGNHVVRVGCYCRVMAEAMGMEREFAETLFLSSPLHDIGKIGIPDSILLKKGRLTAEEWEVMKQHTVIGAKILQQDPKLRRAFLWWNGNGHDETSWDSNPILEMASSIALNHHERWDGTGYPRGVAGGDIPLEARIVAIADVYDALRSECSYKPAFSESETLRIMRDEVGKHFDPQVFACFERCIEECRSIRSQFADEIGAEAQVQQFV